MGLQDENLSGGVFMKTERVDIDGIDVTKRLRPLDPARVEALVASISTIGLRTPLTVTMHKYDGEWRAILVAGNHRLAALRKLGHDLIDCYVVEDGDPAAKLWEIDENLCRNELSPAERAAHTARRKAIYEELHPEVKHGGDRKSDQVDKLSTRSFAEETAAATGKDERSVRRDAERGTKVIPEVLDMLAGTRLDTGTYLDKIKSLPPNDQVHAAKRDLTNMRRQDRADRAKQEAAPATSSNNVIRPQFPVPAPDLDDDGDRYEDEGRAISAFSGALGSMEGLKFSAKAFWKQQGKHGTHGTRLRQAIEYALPILQQLIEEYGRQGSSS